MMTNDNIDTLFSREQDALAQSQGYVDEARVLLEDALSRGTPVKRSRIAAIAVSGAVAAAACALFVLATPSAISVTVEESGVALEVGSWLAAPKKTDLHLAFTDGSRISLEANSEVRLQGLKDHGAHMLLERGAVSASIVHRDETDWRLDAGPYHIQVTGTKFDVGWSPEKKALHLEVREGSVVVDGPMLADGQILTKGNRIHLSLIDESLQITKRSTVKKEVSSIVSSEAIPEPQKANETPRSAPSVAHPTALGQGARWPNASGADRSRNLSWQQLAKKGEYVDAVTQAERTGFGKIVATSNIEDLMLLGDAARLAENSGRAIRAYKAVRSRFPGTPEAQRSAFTLGRIAFESRGRYREAARWFGACANDDMTGPMAREAAGRVIEALDKAGDDDGAARAASTYLKQYANGPHAKLAKQILAKSGAPQ